LAIARPVQWDAVAAPTAVLKRLRERAAISLPQLEGIALATVSGLTGLGLDAMMKAVFAADAVWNRRVSTAGLNRWLAVAQERHPPPLVSGRRLRLRYMTQVNTRPPTFALFASKPADLPDSYRRYLVNGLPGFRSPRHPDPDDAAQGQEPLRSR